MSAPAEGDQVGRFVIEGVLGTGGAGIVYLAHDPDLDRKVALKLLRDRTHGDARQDLLGEARAAGRLAHPNVVAVYEIGEHDGSVFIAMEYVEGRSLASWLHERPRPWAEVLEALLAHPLAKP